MNQPAAPGEGLEQELFARRQKIYPREVHGLFAGLRVAATLALLGIYYGTPWLTWGDRPAVLFDLPARKFYVFGLSFWPQDFFYLAAALIIAALSLFFFTALAGRLWCGYACPQTVWTEVFLWIERKVEGGRPRQMKLDRARWSARKFAIKGTKHFLWIAFSLWTGFTFVAYFTPITQLAGKVMSLSTGGWETFWLLFYSLATYGNAGWLREQVCIYMCPYARFQSAMFDRDTLIISYDARRGEPRGSRRRGADPAALGIGDCVACSMCVQVCPTGIDIRDGLQYQCIGCAACIDACDDIMDRMGYRRGLVRYTTERALAGGAPRVLRPRIVVYGVLLLAGLAGIIYGISQRVPVALDVIRDRNALFRETDDGLIENVYKLKILNKDEREHRYRLSASGVEGLMLLVDEVDIRIAAGQVHDVAARLRADRSRLLHPSSDVTFRVQALGQPHIAASERARFLGPTGTLR